MHEEETLMPHQQIIPAIELPDSRTLRAVFDPELAEATSLAVVDVPTSARAKELMRLLAVRKKAALEKLDPLCKQTKAAHTQAVKLRDEVIDPLDNVIRALAQKDYAYEAEARRKAEEEARRLQEQAKKREEERRLAEAIAAEQSGAKPAEVTAILEEEYDPPAPAVAPAVAKVEGVSKARTLWKAEVRDLAKLIAHVAKNPDLSHYLEPVMPALNKLAGALKKAGEILPGVVGVEEAARPAIRT
jgi:hypothetical protein